MEQFEAGGDEVAAAYQRGNLALLHMARDEWSEARGLLTECLEVARSKGDRYFARSVVCFLARSSAELEDWEGTEGLLEEERRLAGQGAVVDPDGPRNLEALGVRALETGRPGTAVAAFEQAAEGWRLLSRPERAADAARRARELER